MSFFRRIGNTRQESNVDTACEVSIEADGCDFSTFANIQTSLRGQQERIRLLASTTESEFLNIGSRLQDFYTRTAEVGTVTSNVTEELGGDEIKRDIGELGDIIDEMQDFLANLKSEAATSSNSLRETLLMVAKVYDPLTGFKKIMKVLHVLGTSTKIESARLGQLGVSFQNVADDVENLAVQINEKSARILVDNMSLSKKIADTLERVSDIEAALNEDVGLVLSRTRSSLELISDVHRKCSEVAESIAATSSEVSRYIYEIVTSMQFHDITRQQLEHVQEALMDLETKMAEMHDNQISSSAGKELAGEMYSVCHLQSAQLTHARELFTKAVSEIISNLGGLADKGRSFAVQTRGMISVTGGAGDSLFVEIEKNLNPVIEVLAKSIIENRNLADAVGSVAETVEEITSFVNDIETIGEEIKLIALNSQVKAALTGAEGAALGVLAEAIQRLSIDACTQTAVVTETLNEITRVTEHLKSGSSLESKTHDVDFEGMSARLNKLIESIRYMNERVMASLEKADIDVQELSNDIDSATVGITVHEEVSAEVNGITAELDRIISDARAVSPELAMLDLSELSSRYTMHSERAIHATITGGVMLEQSDESDPAWNDPLSDVSGSSEDELGDNVELF